MPGEWPPAVTLQASDSAWGAIRLAFLRIVTAAGRQWAIDCGTKRQPYSSKTDWVPYPLSFLIYNVFGIYMIERADYFGDPDALLTAAMTGDLEAGMLLLVQGADPNQKDELGRTPLMVAIQEGWGYCWTELLIQFKADVNALDNDGDSALDLALYYEQQDTAQVLRGIGALCKNGPSAKQISDDEIYEGFREINAVKNFISMIERNKKS